MFLEHFLTADNEKFDAEFSTQIFLEHFLSTPAMKGSLGSSREKELIMFALEFSTQFFLNTFSAGRQ